MTDTVLLPALFDLGQTLDCGQAFRWKCVSPQEDAWEGVAGKRFLHLKREGNFLALSCPQEETDFWRDYFDLDEDYDAMRQRLSSMHPVLGEAVRFAPGIRILRQDPWEALCSFLISQNNNIPRIKGILEKLCGLFGEQIPGTAFYSFPEPETLAALREEDLAPLRAGYRAKYLIDAAQKVAAKQIDLEAIKSSPAADGREELKKILGVGPKVAECVLLYGFHKMECFPMDVWMKRVMAQLLPGLSPGDFGADAGLTQQCLFHYARCHQEIFTPPSKAPPKAR